MTDYITSSDFRSRHGITTTNNDPRIDEHITTASREVDGYCGRQFGPHDGAATARTFRPAACGIIRPNDCYDITLVEVDWSADGTFEAIDSSSYETDPANGIGPNGQAGWPVDTIRLVDTNLSALPTWSQRRTVRITAKWGWQAVPADVKEATHLVANRLYYENDVPSGSTAPNIEFGLPGAALSRPYTKERLLELYRRVERVFGID